MIFFLFQSIFLLLLSFFIGYVVARFIKRSLYRRATRKTGSTDSSIEARAESVSSTLQVAGIGHGTEFPISIKPSNLQIIEGIGPKMESVLNENGIANWSQLAAKTIPELQSILDKYGNRYQIINPTIWREQARLAADGEVNQLIVLQKTDGASKLENMMFQGKQNGFAKYKKDDLKIAEGIGPKIEALLNSADIDTWQQLAKTELSAIKIILHAAGPSYRLAAPESWSLQARLANNGDWSKLKQIQDKLRQIRPKQIERETAEAV